LGAIWHTVRVRVPRRLDDDAAAHLHVPGGCGSWVRPEGEGSVLVEATYDSEGAARAGARAVSRFLERSGLARTVELGRTEDEPWVERVEAARGPVALPGGFRILPRPEEGGPTVARELVIPPTRAFGTGEHPTTRLTCAGLLREVGPGRSVLDLGTGSGLLAFVAARLGASPVLAVDVDPEAVAVARENRALNGLEESVWLMAGSVEAIAGEFDLVLANIEREVLRAEAKAIASRQRPGGRAVVSGLLAEDAGALREDWATAGYRTARTDTEDGWCALTLLRTGDC
jgi:ribosomal protein L11 methyltransferase